MLNTEPRTIAMKEMFVWYDGPQLLEGGDTDGAFILVAVPCDDEHWAFLVAEVEDSTMEEFKAGTLDCRTMFVERHVGHFWTADGMESDGQTIVIAPFHGLLFEDWLPQEGLRIMRSDEE